MKKYMLLYSNISVMYLYLYTPDFQATVPVLLYLYLCTVPLINNEPWMGRVEQQLKHSKSLSVTSLQMKLWGLTIISLTVQIWKYYLALLEILVSW